MKYIILFLALGLGALSYGQEAHTQVDLQEGRFAKLEQAHKQNKLQQERLERRINELNRQIKRQAEELGKLQGESKSLRGDTDSLAQSHQQSEERLLSRAESLGQGIANAERSLSVQTADLQRRTYWGIGLGLSVLLILGLVVWYLRGRITQGAGAVDDVRRAQEALSKAQAKMQEEACRLDNKLLELIDKQMSVPVQQGASPSEQDHGLALKVADEIVRIELNMSRMDANIKGYKQLSKAVQRIKDNFSANGYEIVDMLGKPYDEGMKIVANFTIDEELPKGTQKITSITKPQVNYNGVMIQSAQVVVSQNI